MTNVNSFDIVIVGGGAVGSALACALKDSGLEIALLDQRAPAPYDAKAEVDLRVFALSLASRQLLKALGAWDGIEKARLSPYREMHVWDSEGKGSIHFDSADLGEPE